MKKELDIDYDISVDYMTPIGPEHETETFKIKSAEFYPKKGKLVSMNILSNGIEAGTSGSKQIFAMKDGTFVLEIEDWTDEDNEVKYFYSDNIKDLLD